MGFDSALSALAVGGQVFEGGQVFHDSEYWMCACVTTTQKGRSQLPTENTPRILIFEAQCAFSSDNEKTTQHETRKGPFT
jgi:hypothetical protein